MTKFHDSLLAAATAVLIMIEVGRPNANAQIHYEFIKAVCLTGDEIESERRMLLEDTALRFVRTVLSADPKAAHATLASQTQKTLSADEFADAVHRTIQPWAPYTDLHVTQIHLVTIIDGGYEGKMPCGKLARPEDRFTVAVTPVPEQAHVIVEGDSKNNGWAFVLWLVREADWRVHYFYFAAAEMVGNSAGDVWNLAREQNRRGHRFNAAVLYRTADTLADRGRAFQLGIQSEIRREMADLELPAELSTAFPVTWKLHDSAFEITGVEALGVGGKIYLYITQRVESFADEKEADQRNRELISAFTQAFPEYADAFAGLVAAVVERSGNRGYRTVHKVEVPAN